MSWFSLLLAGFQVATYGRFWVATEGYSANLCQFEGFWLVLVTTVMGQETSRWIDFLSKMLESLR
jgi:hypothetical protein